jgi:hypothetical protein
MPAMIRVKPMISPAALTAAPTYMSSGNDKTTNT